MTYHSFDIAEAEKYGIEKAILLKHLRFWLDKELANSNRDEEDSGPKIKQHSDRKTYVWTYNSSGAFAKLFPYMKERSIARWLKELEEDGIIFSGNFNKSRYDRTKWYSMPEYCICQNGESKTQNGESKSQNEESKTQNGGPIPDINTYINTDRNTDIILQEQNSFELSLVKETKPRDPYWDSVCEVCSIDPNKVTRSLAGLVGKVVKEIKQVSDNPQEIYEKAQIWQILHPDIPLTPPTLAKHWPMLNRQRVATIMSKKTRDEKLRDYEQQQKMTQILSNLETQKEIS